MRKKFSTPLSEKTGPRKEKTQKMTNFRPKMDKIWPKKGVTNFVLINPLKGSKTRNLAKNYNFSLILSQFIGFFRVKKAFFGGLSPISVNIRLFRDKYDIKTPKNHRRLNTGHFLTNISHFGESNLVYLSNNGP